MRVRSGGQGIGIEAGMIGDFEVCSSVDHRSIYVSMFWNTERQRCGRLIFPPRLKARLELLDYPALDEDMRFDAAFAYAMFIAMRVGLPLRLSGDRSVWNPQWGVLHDADRLLPVDAATAAPLN